MNKKVIFLLVQMLGFISAKLTFAQVAPKDSGLVGAEKGSAASERLGEGTGTCVSKSSRAEVIETLKAMDAVQLNAIYGTLKTDGERQHMLQLLEDAKK